jgi:hypothetical protein
VDDPLQPYEGLLSLAELELGLALAGRVFDLDEVAVRRALIVPTLPKRPPDAAAPYIERALALQERTSVVLEAAMGEASGELADRGPGRGAAGAHTPVAESVGGTVSRAG